MPEYLAPGVYIEEVSYRSKSIEGVGTTTTGFVGPTRYGPVNLEPDVITSLAEYERVYGDRQQFDFGNAAKMHNYMWHAARAFFEEGGKRLYISRIFKEKTPAATSKDSPDGRANAYLTKTGVVQTKPNSGDWIRVSARFPGTAGRMRVFLRFLVGQSILGKNDKGDSTVAGLFENDVVVIGTEPAATTPPPPTPPPNDYDFYTAKIELDAQTGEALWKFVNIAGSSKPTLELKNLKIDKKEEIRIIKLSVTTLAVENPEAISQTWDGLALDPDHKSFGTPYSVFSKFDENPANLGDARRLPIVFERNLSAAGKPVLNSGAAVLSLFNQSKNGLAAKLKDSGSTDDDRTIEMLLEGGNDGDRPTATEYAGDIDSKDRKNGLKAFEDIEDISIVAAPGSTFKDPANAPTITRYLISHAERMRYRIAVLDSDDDQAIAEVRATKAKIDSKYADAASL